ncbi:MAG: isochorismatase family protein [Pseudomonadota bacterium]
MTKRIVLASSSRYRASLLRRAGIPFEVIEPGGDESLPGNPAPEDAVVLIAQKKLEDVAPRAGEAVIIASDQAMELEGRMIGKPGTVVRAVDMLMELSGKEHRLLTSLVVRDGYGGGMHTHLDVHKIRLRKLSKKEALQYVQADRPLDCAGAIKIESRGMMLVEKLEGEDYTAIIGLPLIALARILLDVGVNPLLAGEACGAPEAAPGDAFARPWKLDPAHCAVLVIDMQNHFTGEGEGFASSVTGTINRLAGAARKKSVPVIFTQHGHEDPAKDGGMLAAWWGDMIVRGTPGHAFDPALDIRGGDLIVSKKRYSAFAGTPLEALLREKGVRQVIVTGTLTNLCCETTARDAFVRDFEVFFVSDATATVDTEMQKGSLLNLSFGFAHVVTAQELIRALDGWI